MARRQQKYADQHIQVKESMQYFCVNDKVYVKITRGEDESWQERVVEKAVSPATYLVKIRNAVLFAHVDHLWQRLTTASRLLLQDEDFIPSQDHHQHNEHITRENGKITDVATLA